MNMYKTGQFCWQANTKSISAFALANGKQNAKKRPAKQLGARAGQTTSKQQRKQLKQRRLKPTASTAQPAAAKSESEISAFN